MSREWQPGDVARIKGDGMDALAIRTDNDSWVWVDTQGSNPLYGASFCAGSSIGGNRTARPLVVIDHQSGDVDRLAEFVDRFSESGVSRRDALAAALGEFANPTPPRPEEPTGLGAVVEDVEGGRWVRAGLGVAGTDALPWEGVYPNRRDDCRHWRDVPAARVLSKGWSE